MDPFLFLLIALALGIPFVAKAIFHHSITWMEMAAQIVVLVVILSGTFMLARGAQTMDVRIVNGEVLSKKRETVSCEHSYSCNCRTKTDSSGRTSTSCDTCYEHFNDYDWVLHTNVGRLLIDRVDRQGSSEPRRFTQARPGDPVAKTQGWTNYVKAAPHSIFHEAPTPEEKALVPAYPDDIHDVHYVNRVFDLRAQGVDTRPWNAALAEKLKSVGPQMGGNIILLLTDRPAYFASVIERTWLRGKSNDTVVVMGVENDTILWAEAFGWSDTPAIYTTLRHDLPGTPLEPDAVLDTVANTVVAQFKPMDKDHFKYLKNDIKLSPTLYGLLIILTIIASGATTAYLHRNDIRPGGSSNRSFKRPSFHRTRRL